MKNNFVILSVVLFFLVSCSTQSVQIEKKFKDDQVVVKINAEKNSPLNPWKVEIKVKAYKINEGTLSFEHQNNKLKSSDISFNWLNENTCDIGFPYEDGSIRKFQLIASPESYHLAEISE